MLKSNIAKVVAAIAATTAFTVAVFAGTGALAKDSVKTTGDGTRLDRVDLPISVNGKPMRITVKPSEIEGEYCVGLTGGDGGGAFCSANWNMSKRAFPATVFSPVESSQTKVDGAAATAGVTLVLADPDRAIVATNSARLGVDQVSEVGLQIKGNPVIAYVQALPAGQTVSKDGANPVEVGYR